MSLPFVRLSTVGSDFDLLDGHEENSEEILEEKLRQIQLSTLKAKKRLRKNFDNVKRHQNVSLPLTLMANPGKLVRFFSKSARPISGRPISGKLIHICPGSHFMIFKCYFSTKCSVLDELSRNRSRSCLGNLPIRAKSTKVRGHKGHSPSDESFHKQEILLYSVFYPVKGFGCISDYPNLDKPSTSPYFLFDFIGITDLF